MRQVVPASMYSYTRAETAEGLTSLVSLQLEAGIPSPPVTEAETEACAANSTSGQHKPERSHLLVLVRINELDEVEIW